MKAAYQFFIPTSISETLQLLSDYANDARILAGGTDLVLNVKNGSTQPGHIVSLNRVKEMDFISDNDGIHIGAMTTHHQAVTSPVIRDNYIALAEGCSYVGSRQIRNLATIGGNVCNALPCADSVPPMVAGGAEMVIMNAAGSRRMAVKDFITGPHKTMIKPGELVTEFILPARQRGTGSAYLVHTTRNALDLTFVGVAVCLILTADGEKIDAVKISPANCSPSPLLIPEAEKAIVGNKLTDELLDEVAELTVRGSKVRDSAVRATAAYRKEVLRVLTRRCIKLAYQRAASDQQRSNS